MNRFNEFKYVNELKPGLNRINIKIRCSSKSEEKEVFSKKSGKFLRVVEALVGDETGCILLTLWEDDIDNVQMDKVYLLKNVYTTLFRGSLRLSLGKYGYLEEIDENNSSEINKENNVSDIIYEQKQKYRPRYDNDRSFSGIKRSNRYNKRNIHIEDIREDIRKIFSIIECKKYFHKLFYLIA